MTAIAAASIPLQAAVRASDFIASIGVNTAIGATWSSYGNLATVEYALSYLGVSNVRDAYRNDDDVYRFQQLATELGIKFDFHLDNTPNGADWEIAQILATPSLVHMVEGPNEVDVSPVTYHSRTGLAAAYAEQSALYAAVKSSLALTNVTRTTPVIQASFVQTATFSAAGNWSAVSDYGNSHEYFGNGLPPSSNITTYINLAHQVSPGQQIVATEGGYYTLPSATGVNALVQAKYDLTLLFDDWQAGIPMTYLFELLDENPDNAGADPLLHFGLFSPTGIAKTAAMAVHNLVALLNDPGSTSGTSSLGYAITGLPSTGHSMLMSKANGDFVIAIWNDVQLWNHATASEISIATTPVTLSLAQAFQHIAVYDPLDGLAPVSSFANVSQIALRALDHPILVVLSANPAQQLSVMQPVITKLVQSGQAAANLWTDVLASVRETNSSYLPSLTIQSVSTAGSRGIRDAITDGTQSDLQGPDL